jgi:hypothetical protein
MDAVLWNGLSRGCRTEDCQDFELNLTILVWRLFLFSGLIILCPCHEDWAALMLVSKKLFKFLAISSSSEWWSWQCSVVLVHVFRSIDMVKCKSKFWWSFPPCGWRELRRLIICVSIPRHEDWIVVTKTKKTCSNPFLIKMLEFLNANPAVKSWCIIQRFSRAYQLWRRAMHQLKLLVVSPWYGKYLYHSGKAIYSIG